MNSRLLVFLLVCIVALPVAGPATAVAAAADGSPTGASTPAENATLGDPTVSGPGVHRPATGDDTFLWRGERTNVSVTVRTGDVSERSYDVCVYLPSAPEGERELACEWVSLPGNATRNVTVPVADWPATPATNATAEQPVVVRLEAGFYDGSLGSASVPVRLVSKAGSVDGDDLTNGEEARLGTDLTSKDTDGDGLWDDVESREYGTDPRRVDTDGDGRPDALEVSGTTDPLERDTDGDGIADGTEVDDYGTNPSRADTDGDGLGDAAEVFGHETSPTAADTDGDGLDDGAEVRDRGTGPTEADTDGDGLDDGAEVDDHGTLPTEADTDGDGLGDAAEVRDHGTDPVAADTDGDGLGDGVEVRFGTGPRNSLSPWFLVAAALVLLGVVRTAVPGVRLDVERRRYAGRDVPVPVVREADDGDAPARERADPPTPPSARAGAERGFDRPGGVDGDDAPPLFRDEDRVARLLDEAGGSVRQQVIVRETGWSKSKVSRLLSKMEEEGRVTKIAVGRENVVSLPGREPPGTESSLDD